MRARLAAVVGVAVMIARTAQMAAQQFPPRAGGPPPTPRASAAIDLTGVWVSIVNEDWRWRMVTAPRGDFPGLPLRPAGREIAMAWDPKTDGSCKAFGAAALMRTPTRVRIAWADDSTLKIETDNGQQTRLLHFEPGARPAAPSLQGDSAGGVETDDAAESNPFGISCPVARPSAGRLAAGGDDESAGGWLRRNGVPYSAERDGHGIFRPVPWPDGAEWFVVTTGGRGSEYLLGVS